MLIFMIFIQYIAIVSAANDHVLKFKYSHPILFERSESETAILRSSRKTVRTKIGPETPTCNQMKLTQASPFVVIMLFKTSGRFLGMGSIIDKETIITAFAVVKLTLEKPSNLLALAGRLNPWWGDNSQVCTAKYIFVHEFDVAIVRLSASLNFNKYVKAIRLLPRNPETYSEDYTRQWIIFGLPRGAWNEPGDYAERTGIYIMKVETEPDKPDDLKACAATYPDVEFNETVQTCTIANYTFGWGCQGSPTVAVDKKNKLQQIAVVTSAGRTADESYHLHTKLGLLLTWIKSHSLIGFVEEDDKY